MQPSSQSPPPIIGQQAASPPPTTSSTQMLQQQQQQQPQPQQLKQDQQQGGMQSAIAAQASKLSRLLSRSSDDLLASVKVRLSSSSTPQSSSLASPYDDPSACPIIGSPRQASSPPSVDSPNAVSTANQQAPSPSPSPSQPQPQQQQQQQPPHSPSQSPVLNFTSPPLGPSGDDKPQLVRWALSRFGGSSSSSSSSSPAASSPSAMDMPSLGETSVVGGSGDASIVGTSPQQGAMFYSQSSSSSSSVSNGGSTDETPALVKWALSSVKGRFSGSASPTPYPPPTEDLVADLILNNDDSVSTSATASAAPGGGVVVPTRGSPPVTAPAQDDNSLVKWATGLLSSSQKGDDKATEEEAYLAQLEAAMAKGGTIKQLTGPPPLPADKSKFRVLALDGGGVRCIMECVILSRIVQMFPNFFDSIDCIAAVSGATPIAGCISLGYPIEVPAKLMELSAIKTLSKGAGNGLTSPKYNEKWLKITSDNTFPNVIMRELPKRVVIPSYRIDFPPAASTTTTTSSSAPPPSPTPPLPPASPILSPRSVKHPLLNENHNSTAPQEEAHWLSFNLQLPWASHAAPQVTFDNAAVPELYNNLKPGNFGEDEYLSNVVMRSAAAPGYFSSFQGCVDGGVFASNPAFAALPLIIGTNPQALGFSPSQVVLLSLGTGRTSKSYFDPSFKDGGVIKWGPRVVDLFQSGAEGLCEWACQMTLSDRYHRVSPILSSDIKLDEFQHFAELKSMATAEDLSATFAWLERYWF
ncbi:patatin family protein [Pelomyxa schiedti]|nr:patatin family protein [Pelomyxa schiedti]